MESKYLPQISHDSLTPCAKMLIGGYVLVVGWFDTQIPNSSSLTGPPRIKQQRKDIHERSSGASIPKVIGCANASYGFSLLLKKEALKGIFQYFLCQPNMFPTFRRRKTWSFFLNLSGQHPCEVRNARRFAISSMLLAGSLPKRLPINTDPVILKQKIKADVVSQMFFLQKTNSSSVGIPSCGSPLVPKYLCISVNR